MGFRGNVFPGKAKLCPSPDVTNKEIEDVMAEFRLYGEAIAGLPEYFPGGPG